MSTQEAQVNQRIVSRVVQMRVELQLEKQDVAAALQMSGAGYTPYEQGIRPFTIAQVFMLARAFGKPVAWLLAIDDPLTADEAEVLWLYRLIDQKRLATDQLRLLAHHPGPE